MTALAPPEARDERACELRKAAAWLAARDGYDFDSELNDDERGQYLDEAVRFLEATAPAILADLDALRRKVAEANEATAQSDRALAAQAAAFFKQEGSLRAATARATEAEARASALEKALKRAALAMESATVFVTSRDRIKRPEGKDWWRGEIEAAGAVENFDAR